MSKKTKTYIVSVVIAMAVGGLSAWLTRGNMNVYQTINKPPLSPPSFLFPMVWSILYILMGIGSAKIYMSCRPGKSAALAIYAASLAVNFFWSIIFFNMQTYTFSFIWLILLIILVAYTVSKYKEINTAAGYLQIPYLIWVIFAGYLNLMISVLN